MTVVTVYEENHGMILVAANDDAAKRALVETDWVNGGSTCDKPDGSDWDYLEAIYGNDWKETFLAFNREQLNNMGFYFRTEELWE